VCLNADLISRHETSCVGATILFIVADKAAMQMPEFEEVRRL